MSNNIETISKTMHIFVLDHETKREIKMMLENELSKYFSESELDYYIESALDSRLCDLEEIIDIYDLKTINVR